jgi:peroxiredoxin
MKINVLLLFAGIFLSGIKIHGQQGNHFLVEMENRSPSVQDLVRGYEGFPGIPFQAMDIKGNNQFLGDYKGKTVILYFWNLSNTISTSQIDALNLLQSRYRDNLQVVSCADDSKEELISYMKQRPIDFPIIPSSSTLSEGPYGGDLGYPKIFMVDEFGVIKWVFPSSSFSSDFDTYKVLEVLHTQLQK